MLLLISHLDVKHEAPGLNPEEENRTKSLLQCSAKGRGREGEGPSRDFVAEGWGTERAPASRRVLAASVR